MRADHICLTTLAITIQQITAFLPFHPNPYTLTHEYSGQDFFNNFEFYNDVDPTNGHVKYVDLTTANSSSLAGFVSGVGSSSTLSIQKPVFLGVDSTTSNITTGRSSTRLSSTQTFNHGLILFDILHMPAPVCGTWPAIWLLGTAAPWPQAGEIDILENVNDEAVNRYTLHTDAGISVTNHTGYHMKGQLLTADCDVNAPNQDRNSGCSILDDLSAKSYGISFNDNGGGVFATLIDAEGIRIWFFPRDSIPTDVLGGAPSPPACRDCLSAAHAHSHPWGLPNARFDGEGSFDDHFRDLKIMINIGFCGDWAGGAWNKSETCSALAPTCEEFVDAHPEAFEDVWWGIGSIKVFETTD